MKEFTEKQLETIENAIIERINDEFDYMTDSNKKDLIDMIIDSLTRMREE